jgi:diaminohydroxyphosphoribosylaminopyrimidine deaminase/5-amino-6-(5-phosphoribosylamino)uracil reductase
VVDLAHVEGRVIEADAGHMRRALWHAARGLGGTSPNPIVGAVVVDDDDVVVGIGHHRRAGGPHAEVVALEAAGPRARGATLYCTLEPCSHTNRTGPCAVAVFDAGVRRVVVATGDPNPRVSGAGLAYLRQRGVEVTVGVGRAEAVSQNAPFFSVMQRGRPWVIAKVAMSLDGGIAAAPGQRTQITGALAQRWTQRLRGTVDAVAVGVQTVLVDDPLLTARDVCRHRPLTRVVFDRHLRTPPEAKLFGTMDAGPIVLVTRSSSATSAAAHRLRDAGATLVSCDGTIADAVGVLARHDVMTLLVEGGPTLHAAMFEAGLVDRLAELVADHPLGPAAVRSGIPAGATDVRRRRILPLGRDVLMEGDVHRTD